MHLVLQRSVALVVSRNVSEKVAEVGAVTIHHVVECVSGIMLVAHAHEARAEVCEDANEHGAVGHGHGLGLVHDGIVGVVRVRVKVQTRLPIGYRDRTNVQLWAVVRRRRGRSCAFRQR